MATKEKPNSKENKDPMEVEVMNTQSRQRYIRDYDNDTRGLEDLATSEDPVERESQSFKCDFVDHLSWVLAKISLLDLLKID